MKVALVSLARRGGMVHFQAELANALLPITPTVVLTSKAAPAYLYSETLPRISLDTGASPLGSAVRAANPVMWTRLWLELRAAGVDLIHIVGAHEWNPILALLANLAGTPLVYTVHDPVAHAGAPARMRISDWLTTRLAQAIVALTQRGRRDLTSNGLPQTKIHYIPHGAYSFFTRWRRVGARSEKLLLYFGRIEPYKGLEVLLAAFSSLRHVLPGWRLMVAGSGPLPEAFRRTALPEVELLNRYIADQEVATLMQRARIVVLPYTQATQSGVIATAYAFGRPVITTKVGGLSEMVIPGKTGLLVRPNDIHALAAAVRMLACNPGKVAKMSKTALSLAHGELSWGRIAREHARMYSQVLSQGKRH